jgi:two-component system, OmpR family, response regulator
MGGSATPVSALPNQAFRSTSAGSGKPARILLVEDDTALAGEAGAELVSLGYDVVKVTTAEAGLDEVLRSSFDLLVLDRMLPGLDGLSMIERLRARGRFMPVLVVSALDAVDDRVRGLKAGGDDYLTKPFALVELAARVEALLRRPAEPRETTLRNGDLELDLLARTLRRRGELVDLLPREFRLLAYFMHRPGQLVTRDMLLEDVWHYRFLPQTNLVDVHLGKLRRKIDLPGEPSLIQNVRGAGFIFRAPD